MKILTAVLAVLFVFGGTVSAQKHPARLKAHAMTGYLVDAMCGKNMVKSGPEKAMVKAKKHTLTCNLDPGCAASGYGIVSAGTFYPFDAQGNSLATAFLNNVKKADNLEVSVLGVMNGGVMKVERITDAAPKK